MGLLRKLEDLFSATAFAEAAEFDTARSLAAGKDIGSSGPGGPTAGPALVKGKGRRSRRRAGAAPSRAA